MNLQMPNEHMGLSRYVGEDSAERYANIGLITYILSFVLIMYLNFNSIDGLVALTEAAAHNFQDQEVDTQLMLFGFYSSIYSVIIVRLLIYIIEVEDRSKVMTSLVGYTTLSIGTLFLWGLIFIFVGVSIYTGIYEFLIEPLSDRASLISLISYAVIGFISFGISQYIVILRTKRIFPKKVRDSIDSFEKKCQLLATRIQKIETDIESIEYPETINKLTILNDEIRRLDGSEILREIAEDKKNILENRINETATQVYTAVMANAELKIDSGEYAEAYTDLDIAQKIVDEFDINRHNYEHLQKKIEQIVDKKKQKVKESLETVDDALQEGQIDEAETYLQKAESAFEQLPEIADQNEIDDIETRLQKARSDVNSAREKQRIRDYKNTVADKFDVKPSEVDLRSFDPEKYSQLNQLADSILSAKSSYPELPWKKFESNLVSELSGMSIEQMNEYERIVSDSIEIIEYLEDVSDSHPSIDRDAWRDTVVTALEEQYREILDPVTAQINRLKTGLWNRDHLYNMPWQEFEQLVGSLYETRGYSVEVTQDSADLGVDVWAEKNGKRIAIQAKRYTDDNTVGRETLQKLTSTLAKGDADEAIVVTSGEYARTAIQYADDFGPKLRIIDGEELIQILSEEEIPPPV